MSTRWSSPPTPTPVLLVYLLVYKTSHLGKNGELGTVPHELFSGHGGIVSRLRRVKYKHDILDIDIITTFLGQLRLDEQDLDEK